MLVVRPCDTGRNIWSSSMPKVIPYSRFSRMSNFDRSTSQPDWREQYLAFSLPTENNSASVSSELQKLSDGSYIAQEQEKSNPDLGYQSDMGSIRESTRPESTGEKIDWFQENTQSSEFLSTRDQSLSDLKTTNSLVPIRPTSSSSVPGTQVVLDKGSCAGVEFKDEDVEIEEFEVDTEVGDVNSTQILEERRVEHRKMKRFRLTHNQTRFLMTEFAKHAHPDAAHRERLSREIPGLSPRQVQVWFQNRRAKIKRLTADDRERIIKMRAVPDEFDNLQALHSPYGAIHGVGASMQSSVSFVPNYSENLMRPLMMDSMRSNSESQLPLTALSTSFDSAGMGFNPSSSFSAQDMLSPSSLKSPERHYNHHLPSPMSARGPQSPGSFNRQSRYQSQPQSGHQKRSIGSLQPLQRLDNVLKSKSDSLQYPLRLSMPWKGESLDFPKYQTEQQNPQLCEQQLSVGQIGFSMDHELNTHQYNPNIYSQKGNMGNSPTGIYSSNSHTLSDQSDLPSMSQISQATSNYTYGVDFRNQYRSQVTTNMTTSQAGSFVNAFTTNFLNAPAFMTSPSNFVTGDHNLSPVRNGQSGKSYEIQDPSTDD